MTPFAKIIDSCGLSLRGAAMLLRISYSYARGISRGVRNAQPEHMEKLTELKREIDRIFHKSG